MSWSVLDTDGQVRALAGEHRVQRVPATEKRGRRHSSLIRVAVLEGVGEAAGRVRVDRADVRVETFRASGPGGQHRNKTESGVRLLHVPTGVVVTATEDRSQHENRAVAWRRLEQALLRSRTDRVAAVRNGDRVSQLDAGRSFTWTGWRDEVRRPDGVKVSMRRVLRGRLGLLWD